MSEVEVGGTVNKSTISVKELDTSDEKKLEKLATEEILKEALRGAVRAESVGPSGWLKCPLPKTNKIFLKNTIKQVVTSNNYRNRHMLKRPVTSSKDLIDSSPRTNKRYCKYKEQKS